MEIEYLKDKAKSFLLPREENDYRAKIFSGNFLIFFLIGIAFLKVSFAVFLYSFTGNSFYADVTKTALIDLTNYERAKNSLPALTENPVLSQAAHMKALDMAQNGYFNHVSPSGVNPWHWFSLAGYNYRYAGENLAIGFVDSKEVQDAWTASPSHKANIINEKYREIGIAVLKANFQGNPATIVVQMFGTRSALNKTAAATEIKSADILPQTAAAPEAEARQNVMGAATVAADESAPGFKIAAFFANKFYPLAQWLIYLSLAGVILLLAVNFFLKADLAHSDLLAKAAGFTAVMIVFALLDQGLISALIPRSFGI